MVVAIHEGSTVSLPLTPKNRPGVDVTLIIGWWVGIRVHLRHVASCRHFGTRRGADFGGSSPISLPDPLPPEIGENRGQSAAE